jgi:hypothetical protein
VPCLSDDDQIHRTLLDPKLGRLGEVIECPVNDLGVLRARRDFLQPLLPCLAHTLRRLNGDQGVDVPRGILVGGRSDHQARKDTCPRSWFEDFESALVYVLREDVVYLLERSSWV